MAHAAESARFLSPRVDSVTLAASASVKVSGTGTLTVKCSRNVVLNCGSSLQSVDGAIRVEANQQAVPTAGNFIGVRVNGGLIQATGTGLVTVKGKGGNDAGGSQNGVLVTAGGDIIGGTSGPLTVEGAGGANAGSFNYGV